MDYLNIDEEVEVLEIPERSAEMNVDGRDCIEKESPPILIDLVSDDNDSSDDDDSPRVEGKGAMDHRILIDLVSEDDDDSPRLKEKGIMDHPFLEKESGRKTMHLSTSDNEDNITGDDSPKDWDATCQHGSTPTVGHCRAAIPLNKRLRHSSSSDHGECSTWSISQPLENIELRRDTGDGMSNSSLRNWDAGSRQHGSASPLAQTSSSIMSYLDQFDECCDAAISRMERIKAGSTFGNHDESSRAGQITFLGSNRIQNRQHLGISNPVGTRNIAPPNIGCSRNVDSDARARQIETDEMLDRELQEQFNNEVPEVAELQRINIADALEAFTSRVADNLLPVQRVSNGHKYETLFALDENNRYIGASIDQINELPQATVQTNRFEEPCAICLESLTTGDIIRHLPCLHKFHKHCIDSWLEIRTSCPVCKSSII